jgi:hypothetical protein
MHLALHPESKLDVVTYLAKKEPRALQIRPKDDPEAGRFLPLHHAVVEDASVEIIEHVAKAWPQALQV